MHLVEDEELDMQRARGSHARQRHEQSVPSAWDGKDFEVYMEMRKEWYPGGLSFRSFWPLGHTALEEQAVEDSKGKKDHGAVAVQGMLITSSHQWLNPPEENHFEHYLTNPIPVLLKLEEIFEELPYETCGGGRTTFMILQKGRWWKKSWGWTVLVDLSHPLVRVASRAGSPWNTRCLC